MLVRPAARLYALLTDDGVVIPDTVLTEAEFNCPLFRQAAESLADCSRILWADVTDVKEFWLDDTQTFALTDAGADYLQSASIA
jgi:hypothetical protein